MLASGSLTSSPTSLFWLTIGLLILTIAIVAIGIITWRSTAVHKKLLLTIASRSRLLSAPESMRDELQIVYNDEPIRDNPYVVALELTNAGRSPIKTDDFDSKRSLRIGLDTKIIKLLSVEQSPREAPEPKVTTNGVTLSLAPELIKRGEVIKIALLTEGRPAQARTLFSPFGEVSIVIGDREAQASKERRRNRILGGTFAGLTASVLVAGFWTLIAALNSSNNTLANSEWFADCNSLSRDLSITTSALQIVESETLAVQEPRSGSQLLGPYYQLLAAAQKDLGNLQSDYTIIDYDGNPAVKSAGELSAIQRSDAFIVKMAQVKGNQALSKLVNELVPEEKFLSQPSATPSSCDSMGSGGGSGSGW